MYCFFQNWHLKKLPKTKENVCLIVQCCSTIRFCLNQWVTWHGGYWKSWPLIWKTGAGGFTFSYSNTKLPIHNKQICFNLYCSETSQHGFGVNRSTNVEVTEKRQFFFHIESVKNKDMCSSIHVTLKKMLPHLLLSLFPAFTCSRVKGMGGRRLQKLHKYFEEYLNFYRWLLPAVKLRWKKWFLNTMNTAVPIIIFAFLPCNVEENVNNDLWLNVSQSYIILYYIVLYYIILKKPQLTFHEHHFVGRHYENIYTSVYYQGLYLKRLFCRKPQVSINRLCNYLLRPPFLWKVQYDLKRGHPVV